MSWVVPADIQSWAPELQLSVEDVATLQAKIDGVEAGLSKVYDLPVVPVPDVKLAIIIQSFMVWNERNTPTGLLGFGESGSRQVMSLHPQAKALLQPYRAWRVG